MTTPHYEQLHQAEISVAIPPKTEVLQSDTSNILSVDSMPSSAKEELVPVKRGWRFYGAFASLCVVNLVLALDGTSVSVALPVCVLCDLSHHIEARRLILMVVTTDHSSRTQWDRHSSFLDWDIISFDFSCGTANVRITVSHLRTSTTFIVCFDTLHSGSYRCRGSTQYRHADRRPMFARCWWWWGHCAILYHHN